MKVIALSVRGVSPLLMNRMSDDALLSLRSKKKAAKSLSRDTLPRDEAAAKVYTTQDTGQPYIPAENLLSCIIAGGSYVRMDGKRQMSTGKSSMVPGFLEIHQTALLLTPGDWEVDMRQGRNPNGGEAVCIVRPRFDRWAFDATVSIDDEQVSEPQVRELLDISLKRVGLGDFRPARKGPFGRAVVESWKIAD